MIEEKTRVPNHRYQLVGPDGLAYGTFGSTVTAAEEAERRWPGVGQRDHENGRNGWDIEVIR